MINLKPSLPKRIVCLTEETTETLYTIGASDLIVGITEYTVRPPQARAEKPIVSRFLDANIENIINLKPDIVLGWSDLQADIAKDLIKSGIEYYNFNHRDINGILSMILRLGAVVGKLNEAEMLVEELINKISHTKMLSDKNLYRPKVYFEEWFNPIISGICWVSEIIEVCGGDDIFAENRIHQAAKDRIIENSNEIVKHNPDIIFVSWCGKPFRKKTMLKREKWEDLTAVIHNEIHEIDSAIILQPGPASLTDGLDIISKIIKDWNDKKKG
ncbi:cobalamin-binding protein [Candidatus Kapaibacterium sp.]